MWNINQLIVVHSGAIALFTKQTDAGLADYVCCGGTVYRFFLSTRYHQTKAIHTTATAIWPEYSDSLQFTIYCLFPSALGLAYVVL